MYYFYLNGENHIITPISEKTIIQSIKNRLTRLGVKFEDYIESLGINIQMCRCQDAKKSRFKPLFKITDNLIEIYDIEYPKLKGLDSLICHGPCEITKSNPNSVKRISACTGIDTDNALKLIRNTNKSPFYRENHIDENAYKKYQARDIDFLGEERYKLFCEKISKSSKLESYIEKYGEEEGTKKYKSICAKKDSVSIKHFSKYGDLAEELRAKRIDSIKNTLSNYIQKYGEEEGTKKYNVLNNKLRNIMTEDYHINKYGEEIGKLKWQEKRLKFSITLDNLIKKYGLEEGSKKYQSWLTKITAGFTKKYSLASYNFFELLNNDLNIETCIYGENEYFIYDKKESKIKFYDFKYKNIIIEYNGVVFHPRENHFNSREEFENYRVPFTGLTGHEKEILDLNKIQLAETNGFSVLEIFDNISIDKNLEICKNFIQQNLK